MREAASLAPKNSQVQEALLHIQSSEHATHILKKLCHQFALEDNGQAGKDALAYLSGSGDVPGDVAPDCLGLLTTGCQNLHDRDSQDGIISGLLRRSPEARASLAARLQGSATQVFNEIYMIGDDSVNKMVAVVLDQSAWPNEAVRKVCERDVFQLFLAKLIEAGHDLDGRALRGISTLLATDPDKLRGLLDEETFSVILGCLDNRLSMEVRSQALLATAKYLEAAEDRGQQYLSRYITTRVARHNREDMVLAFSAAAAIFPIVPSIASALFLTEGFVPSLVPILEKRSTSDKVQQAGLEMLSAACVDTACRDAIRKHCSGWLQNVVDTGKGQSPGVAAVILAKILGPFAVKKSEKSQDRKENVQDLVPMFKQMISDNTGTHRQSAIEGLAYASVQPAVKERLASDNEFLTTLLRALRDSQASTTTAFGGLSIIDNLTRYLPVLSEEQKRMAQLKAYANGSKVAAAPDALDEDKAVTKRCDVVIKAGAVSTLVGMSKSKIFASSPAISLALNIFLSLSRTPAYRGSIAQQGGVKLLLQLYDAATDKRAQEFQSRRSAAHALARILISLDPTLIFASGSPPLTSSIRPLLLLLTEDPDQTAEGPRDLLPTFEALLALTNLASTTPPEAAQTIVRLAFPLIEDLLLGKNSLVQRAATELVCNLMACSSGIEIFADDSKAAGRRLHILLALADTEDLGTRRAAGGALATLTEFEGAIKGILAVERGVEILIRLCEDDDDGTVHRGVVSVRNLVCAESPNRPLARRKVKEFHGVEVLRAVSQNTKQIAIEELASEALKALV